MNKKGIEEISLVKLLAFVLIFIVVCLAFTFLVLVPSIADLKAAKTLFNDKSQNLAKIEQIYAMHYNDLAVISEAAQKEVNAISGSFDEIKFVGGAGRFFNDVKLTRLPRVSENEQFLRYELTVSGNIRTPKTFYYFIDYINSYDQNVIKVDFPVTMTSRGSGRIDVSFRIKVYETVIEDNELH